MSTDQVLAGIGLILVLAVGSQVLASRLRIPALIVLLPAGFTVGALTSDVNPEHLLGPAFQPLVSLAVAVILYDSGLALEWGKVRGRARRVVSRLIIVGVPVTWVFGAVFARLLMGLPTGTAVMLGVILVVSGPTVVGPLLAFIRPTERLQRILSWEGSLIDPVGGILGAVVYATILAGGYQPGDFLLSVAIGAAGAAAGVAVLWLCLCKLNLGDVLATTSQLAVVVGVAALCDIGRDDAGLIAAVSMGLALANLPAFDIPARRPFFETLVQLIIGVLFVSISATVTPESLHRLVLPALGLVAVLVLVARRLGVTRPARTRPLLVGGDPWVIDLAHGLRQAGLDVLMWAASQDQRDQIKRSTLELVPGELLAAAIGQGAELEGITTVLLLTDEDDFNALAATVLTSDTSTPIYRLAPRHPSHGVLAPYAAVETLFGPALTRYDVARRYDAGARITLAPADGTIPSGEDVLFLITPDDALIPATTSQALVPRSGDTLVVLR